MNKAELVGEVADKAGVSKAEAESVLGSFFDVVTAEAKKKNKVAWPGFGSFQGRHQAARMVRNPQTGKQQKLGAKTVIKFSASAALKEAVAGKKKAAAKKKGAAKKKKKAAAKKRAR